MPPETSAAPSPTAVEQEAEYSNLPPSTLIEDAHTQLSLIFNSANKSEREAGSDDLSLIVYCPLEGGESVVDSVVEELARRTEAEVQTVDLVECISKQPGEYWKTSEPTEIDKPDLKLDSSSSDNSDDSDSGSDSDSDPDSDNGNKKPSGYFKMRKPIDISKLTSLIETTIARHADHAPRSENRLENCRRIIYLRDVGFMATFAPACYHKVISTVHERLSRETDTSGVSRPVSTAVIIGCSPLLVPGGMFQKAPPKKKPESPNPSSGLFSLLQSLRSNLESLAELISQSP
ncbi:unnamed protein product [Rhizoctonia solani]|uniref:Uncharacterized protein n=1 Tax=Rhizoctonia solani TaxID=456999 RepID=A0A8H3BI83_9AGAM|nr:unnamed protein product [Rhizoctonia solani]